MRCSNVVPTTFTPTIVIPTMIVAINFNYLSINDVEAKSKC
jgi:hypothetical protein